MDQSHKPVVVVGSINIDLVAVAERIPAAGETVLGSDFQIHPGGKGANQAVAVARLGYPVQLVGKVGEDTFGAQLQHSLRSAGVDISAVEVCSGSSGVAVIVVSPQGENSITVIPGANAQLTPDFIEAHLEVIRGAGLVLTQLEIPIATVQHLARLCAREHIPLMLDPAPAQALPAALLKSVRWFTPNETEAAFFMRQIADAASSDPSQLANAFLAQGMSGLVLKMGSRGAYLAESSGTGHLIPAYPVQTIDTTAAGDAFNGAFATALMLGMPAQDAARFASAAAAVSVTRPGAQPSMPTRAEVERFLASQRQGVPRQVEKW